MMALGMGSKMDNHNHLAIETPNANLIAGGRIEAPDAPRLFFASRKHPLVLPRV